MGLALAQLISWSAFAFELDRALSGNRLSWAYVFEWPVLAGYSVFVWHRLLHPKVSQHSDEDQLQESRREAYNEYLDQVHREEDGRG